MVNALCLDDSFIPSKLAEVVMTLTCVLCRVRIPSGTQIILIEVLEVVISKSRKLTAFCHTIFNLFFTYHPTLLH
jgi:hypothetical protein